MSKPADEVEYWQRKFAAADTRIAELEASVKAKADYVADANDRIIAATERVSALEIALSSFLKHCPEDQEHTKDGQFSLACPNCDMGGAGYSTRGDGFHDDRKYICPSIEARRLLATTRQETNDGIVEGHERADTGPALQGHAADSYSQNGRRAGAKPEGTQAPPIETTVQACHPKCGNDDPIHGKLICASCQQFLRDCQDLKSTTQEAADIERDAELRKAGHKLRPEGR